METGKKENMMTSQNTVYEQHNVKYILEFYVCMDKFSERTKISEEEFIRIGGKYATGFISEVNDEILHYSNRSIRDFFEKEINDICIQYTSGFYGKCTDNWDYVFVHIVRSMETTGNEKGV